MRWRRKTPHSMQPRMHVCPAQGSGQSTECKSAHHSAWSDMVNHRIVAEVVPVIVVRRIERNEFVGMGQELLSILLVSISR